MTHQIRCGASMLVSGVVFVVVVVVVSDIVVDAPPSPLMTGACMVANRQEVGKGYDKP